MIVVVNSLSQFLVVFAEFGKKAFVVYQVDGGFVSRAGVLDANLPELVASFASGGEPPAVQPTESEFLIAVPGAIRMFRVMQPTAV